MIDMNFIREFFPVQIRDDPEFRIPMLKEYIQCQILEFISTSPFVTKLAFIGGTSLRLIKHIPRFSEDIDFDCRNFPQSEFLKMTDSVIQFLVNSGFNAVPRVREHDNLSAYRRSIYFPELLFSLGLSGYCNSRFLIKIEMQDQGYDYETVPAFVQSCGFYFPIPVPPDDILCSMKLAALLDRGKGRDFYDVMFLLSKYNPDFDYLSAMKGIRSKSELKAVMETYLPGINLAEKRKDFEHLLFSKQDSGKILHFLSFIESR
ncbi:MAG: nucleotidyl transferase AbiEii/AbiGii toxin family protein [Spirochaetales bacterium]|nr:nucleotidyl transferase AbiEii/AbiGii toxin family protein [Spirochaetales bacterium]